MSLVLNPVYNVLLYLLVHIFLFFLSVISISTLSLSISVTSFLLVYRHMLFSYSSLVYLLYSYICLHHVFFYFNPKLHIFLFSLSCIAISTLSVSISVTTYLLVYRHWLVSYSSLILLHPHLLLPNRRHALIPVHWIIQPHFPFWSIITLSHFFMFCPPFDVYYPSFVFLVISSFLFILYLQKLYHGSLFLIYPCLSSFHIVIAFLFAFAVCFSCITYDLLFLYLYLYLSYHALSFLRLVRRYSVHSRIPLSSPFH